MRMTAWRALLLASSGVGLACAGNGDALARGQRYYEDNQYERALALFRDLDRTNSVWSGPERARFAYFRGMTDYRLGFREDARHWLAVARATSLQRPGSLRQAWLERLEGALVELERQTTGARANGSDVIQSIEIEPTQAAPAEIAPAELPRVLPQGSDGPAPAGPSSDLPDGDAQSPPRADPL